MTPADEATVEAVAKAEAERRGLPCPDGEADDQSGWTFVGGAVWGAAYESARGDVKPDLVKRAFRAADEYEQNRNGEIETWSDGERFTSDDLRALATVATVKPDRETVARIVKPGSWGATQPEPPEGTTQEEWDAIWGRVVAESQAEPLAVADAILALWPGRTEREVKAEAWDECARQMQATPYTSVPNPYRATALEQGEGE